MTRLEALSFATLFVGAALLLSRIPWFARVPLIDRLRPYSPGGLGVTVTRGAWSVESFGEVIAPLSRSLGTAISRLFGVSEELDVKLRRLHLPVDAGEFRTRQVGLTLVAALAAVAIAFGVGLPGPTVVLLTVAAPLLTFLVIEHKVVAASEARQHRLRNELPVVAEQLGMALSAGYSLGAALHRLADRGSGVAAEDLRRVIGRLRQGLTEAEALQEWAELANVEPLDRLVAVLALNREATDLGVLIAEEARTARRDAHRRLLETIERRDQQVWIPVAIAALIPGTILVAIPFVQAMRTFSAA